MTCPDAKTWDLLSMNLLDNDLAESLRQHSVECKRCHNAWQEASRQHTELVDAFQAFDCNHNQRRDQLMATLPESTPVSTKELDIVRRQWWLEEGGIAMTLRRHKTRWAAVASVAAACILLMFLLIAGEKTAFADVLQKMRQAKTMVCDVVTRMTLKETDLRVHYPGIETPRQSKMSMYFDGNMRAVLHETEVPEAYISVATFGRQADEQAADKAKIEADKAAKEVKTRKTRALYMADKAYVWDGDTVRVLTSLDANRQRTAEDWLNRLLEVREAPDRNLGEQMINGRRAVGFEIAGWKLKYGTRPTAGNPTPADSDSLLRVWVDVEQDLPIRIEIEQRMLTHPMKGTIHTQFDNVKWNVPLDAADFQPPSAEELAKAETVQLPAIDEASFVDLMQAWLDSKDKAKSGIELMQKKAEEKRGAVPGEMATFFSGAALDAGYPEKLDTHWLASAVTTRLTLANMAETLPKLKPIPKDLDEEERAKLIKARAKESAMAAGQVSSKAMLKATAAAAFYQKLANEQRDPEYFGATVEPGDAEGILLKWRLDDGRYRVIYGDLHAETVDIAD